MSDTVKEITNENFNKEVIENKGFTLVDFWAPWCGPCKMLSPVLDELEQEMGDKVVFGKVNVDDNMELSTEYGIMNIPTILFFKNGELVERNVGVATKSKLKEMIEKL